MDNVSIRVLVYVGIAFVFAVAFILIKAAARRGKYIQIKRWKLSSLRNKIQMEGVLRIDRRKLPMYTLPEELVNHYCELFDIPLEVAQYLPDTFWQRLMETNLFIFNLGQQLTAMTQERDTIAKEFASATEILDKVYENIQNNKKRK